MKNKIKHLFHIIFFLLGLFGNAQQKKLEILRSKYEKKETKNLLINYKKYREKITKIIPPMPLPIIEKYDKLVRFYEIPFKERLKLFPFDTFDSIYICTPKYVADEEPRNYLDNKYHNEIRLITNEEVKKLTNILFNYYRMRYDFIIQTNSKNYGCEDLVREYPKMILLFKKNGTFINYMAFPDDGKKRTNFIPSDVFEYYKEFDLCEEKEKLILKIFNIN